MEEVKLQTLFLIFFIAIMVDFLTGILAAAKEGKLKSRTCSNGMPDRWSQPPTWHCSSHASTDKNQHRQGCCSRYARCAPL